MKFKLILIVPFFLLYSTSYSQKTTRNKKNNKTYISIRLFKQIYDRTLTKEELETIKIKPNDTLVLINNLSDIENQFSVKKDSLINKTDKVLHQSRSYMTLSQYRKAYNKPLTKTDSENYKFKNGDTLILISDKDFYKKRVSVPYEPKDSVFLEVYKDVVYRKYQKKDTSASKKIRLKHWRHEIKIYFANSIDKTVKNELKSFANYLAKEVDSLNISFVKDIEKSNYIIYGYDSINNYKYDKRIRSNKNDFYISWNGNQWFYDCKLQINKYSYKKKADLILKSKKLFFNTLGRFNYTRKLPKESYLSLLYSKNKKFTNDDLEILKYHYSYGICKGMDLNSFEESHLKAQEIFKKTGNHLHFVNKY